jgi:glycosyltransferase involved in cell wall biosynthesis
MLEKPTVHILMATYNGATYLEEQLASIARQTHSEWTLTVSDDGSSDGTLEIVQRFATQIARPLSLLQGPSKGSSTANFYHLMAQAPAGNVQDLYAFCDQDDVWHDDKLQRAVQWHLLHLGQTIRLYCGRSQVVNEKLLHIGLSPSVIRPPSFGNALVQNIASGNTMVLSHDLLLTLRKIQSKHSIWHDWTTYLVATALEGNVFFDEKPTLLYRQHDSNVIGSNNGIKAQIHRLKPLLSGRYKCWSMKTELAIYDIKDALPSNSLKVFNQFKKIRHSRSLAVRLFYYAKSSVRRQTHKSNILLFIAIIFRLA